MFYNSVIFIIKNGHIFKNFKSTRKSLPESSSLFPEKNVICPIQQRNFCDCSGFEETITKIEDSVKFMTDCFLAVGVSKTNADITATNLVTADFNGHYSHGMNRLAMYIQEIRCDVCMPNAAPVLEKETKSTGYVNGCNGLGAVIGKYCMDLTIKKAMKTGVGVVSCHNSNHYGIAGIYLAQAISNKLIGITYTNSSPLTVPTRSKTVCMGTNPVSLGAPSGDLDYADDFLLDMATSAVALGKVEFYRRKGSKIPYGWALNDKGEITTDPVEAFKASRMLPLGGDELHSNFKGYGLNLLVEIFSAILSGSKYGLQIRPWLTAEVPADLGHFFFALDPNKFLPEFEKRLKEFIRTMRCLEPLDPKRPVMIPGDMERNHRKKVKELGGLSYVPNQIETNLELAKLLKVPPMKFKIVKSNKTKKDDYCKDPNEKKK